MIQTYIQQTNQNPNCFDLLFISLRFWFVDGLDWLGPVTWPAFVRSLPAGGNWDPDLLNGKNTCGHAVGLDWLGSWGIHCGTLSPGFAIIGIIMCLNPVVLISNVTVLYHTISLSGPFLFWGMCSWYHCMISIINHQREPKWLLNHEAPGQQWENPVFIYLIFRFKVVMRKT